jgi:hypothetical protein
MTKREAVEKTLAGQHTPDLTFDYALPQDWLDAETNKLRTYLLSHGKIADLTDCYDRILGQTVWSYPVNSCFGKPLPITEDGRFIANILGW